MTTQTTIIFNEQTPAYETKLDKIGKGLDKVERWAKRNQIVPQLTQCAVDFGKVVVVAFVLTQACHIVGNVMLSMIEE